MSRASVACAGLTVLVLSVVATPATGQVPGAETAPIRDGPTVRADHEIDVPIPDLMENVRIDTDEGCQAAADGCSAYVHVHTDGTDHVHAKLRVLDHCVHALVTDDYEANAWAPTLWTDPDDRLDQYERCS